jgi:threonylcarbamoyladenosine tRNA methylthiotransferase MtaB
MIPSSFNKSCLAIQKFWTANIAFFIENFEFRDSFLSLPKCIHDLIICRLSLFVLQWCVQSAQSKVLSEMKRHYTAEKVEWAFNEIQNRVPGAFVGMDVIVGFPGESEADFAETYERLQKTPWTRIHVFPYSERQGTRAALSSEVVPVVERRRRSQLLRELSFERYSVRAADQIGSLKKVLVLREARSIETSVGLSRDYWNVQLPKVSDEFLGKELAVRITGADTQNGEEGVLFAEVVRGMA